MTPESSRHLRMTKVAQDATKLMQSVHRRNRDR